MSSVHGNTSRAAPAASNNSNGHPPGTGARTGAYTAGGLTNTTSWIPGGNNYSAGGPGGHGGAGPGGRPYALSAASTTANALSFRESHSPAKGCGPRWWRRVNLPSFANDNDRHDFILMGSACGVAASVSAPLGGTMFAADEVRHKGTITTNSHFKSMLIAIN